MHWAEVSNLTAEWQLPRELRRTDHPSGDGEAWALDVRFKHLPSDHDDDQENRRFDQFLAAYQANQGLTFPDKVFYICHRTDEPSRSPECSRTIFGGANPVSQDLART